MSEEEVISELVKRGWSRSTLAVWRRANHRCEYCDADLLFSDAEYFYGGHVDHVVPGAGDALDNLALACKTCNFIKSDRTFFDGGEVPSRAEVVAKAKDFISGKRRENCVRLQEVRDLLSLLPRSGDGRA